MPDTTTPADDGRTAKRLDKLAADFVRLTPGAQINVVNVVKAWADEADAEMGAGDCQLIFQVLKMGIDLAVLDRDDDPDAEDLPPDLDPVDRLNAFLADNRHPLDLLKANELHLWEELRDHTQQIRTDLAAAKDPES